MSFTASSAAQMLEQEEGLRLKVYDDATGLPIGPGSVVKGHPTIGYGRALDANGITVQEASQLLDNTLGQIGAQLAGSPWFCNLNGPRRAVITCMAYQLGVGGVFSFRAMISALDIHAWDAAANAMLDSKWAKQTPARAKRMADAIRTGSYPTYG